MSRSCPLVPGSLIPFYPLIQTMSHSNREEGGDAGWEERVQDGEKRRHDKSWWDLLVWREGGVKRKYSVLRANPHYRKMELWFTSYASSATVYGRNMKRNMTRKANSSWRQSKEDTVQTPVMLQCVSLQTPGTSTQLISRSSPSHDWWCLLITLLVHSSSAFTTLMQMHEKSTSFLFYICTRAHSCHFNATTFSNIDFVWQNWFMWNWLVVIRFFFFSLWHCRSELALCPCTHCCSSSRRRIKTSKVAKSARLETLNNVTQHGD